MKNNKDAKKKGKKADKQTTEIIKEVSAGLAQTAQEMKDVITAPSNAPPESQPVATGRNIAPLFSSGFQNWQTPPDLFQHLHKAFNFELDPCTTRDNPLGTKTFLTKEQDALSRPWLLDAFVNPPFGEAKIDKDGNPIINKKGKPVQTAILDKWVRHAAEQHKQQGITIVLICANRTETEAYQKYAFPTVQVVVAINKRVAFIDPDKGQKLSPTFGSMLLVWKKEPLTKEQMQALAEVGTVLKPLIHNAT